MVEYIAFGSLANLSPVTFPNATAAISSKIDVWKELYEVPQRVEQHIVTNFCERIAGDLNLTAQDDDYKREVWAMLRPKLMLASENDMAEVFG